MLCIKTCVIYYTTKSQRQLHNTAWLFEKTSRAVFRSIHLKHKHRSEMIQINSTD